LGAEGEGISGGAVPEKVSKSNLEKDGLSPKGVNQKLNKDSRRKIIEGSKTGVRETFQIWAKKEKFQGCLKEEPTNTGKDREKENITASSHINLCPRNEIDILNPPRIRSGKR